MEYLKFMEKGCIGEYSGITLEPDVWLPEVGGSLELCHNGYHFCKAKDAVSWINTELYSVETRGEVLVGDEKMCARSIRMTRIPAWNERTAHLFAADCAERVLPIYETQFPDDDRPARAIEAARLFANGGITVKQMAAARPAARAAARAAAWAARAAARAAAWGAARDAAGAARAAAWDTAGAAARAAWAAEREWQTARLLEYISGEAG